MSQNHSLSNGMRVLLVDHDPASLILVKDLLICCTYKVTTCSNGSEALKALGENEGCVDMVLLDVRISDMDAYALLQRITTEINLPVILISDDSESRDWVVRGVKEGACDFLVKPITEKELRLIWRHVARKILQEKRERESSKSNDIGSCNAAMKKPRLVWSNELKQKFEDAIKQLELQGKKITPKKIMEVMGDPGDMTKAHIGSHLQKYRMNLKRKAEEKDSPGPGPDLGMVMASSSHLGFEDWGFPYLGPASDLAQYEASSLTQEMAFFNTHFPPL